MSTVNEWFLKGSQSTGDTYGQLDEVNRTATRTQETKTRCGNDGDCATGFVCKSGTCTQSFASTNNPNNPATVCNGNSGGSGCCEASGSGCQGGGSDCSNGGGCEDGIKYIGNNGDQACHSGPCSSENPCPPGYNCQATTCVKNECGGYAGGCPTGMICCGGVCTSQCSGKDCSSNYDCSGGYSCVDGKCRNLYLECTPYCQQYYLLTGNFDADFDCFNKTCGPCGACFEAETGVEYGYRCGNPPSISTLPCKCQLLEIGQNNCYQCAIPNAVVAPDLDCNQSQAYNCVEAFRFGPMSCDCGAEVDLGIVYLSPCLSLQQRADAVDKKVKEACDKACPEQDCEGECTNSTVPCADPYNFDPNEASGCPPGFVCKNTGFITVGDQSVCLYQNCNIANLPVECRGTAVLAISVIDEDDNYAPGAKNADWKRYRENNPEGIFSVIKLPDNTGGGFTYPAGYDGSVQPASRNASDTAWTGFYSSLLPRIASANIWVDTSGSTTYDEVSASVEGLRAYFISEGKSCTILATSQENWIAPHI